MSNTEAGTMPAPASLVHKSRTIIAVNEACRAGGRNPGMNCAQWNSPEQHRGCLANRMLKEQQPFYKEVRRVDGVCRVYWLPVSDYPDFYLHFTTEPINNTEKTSLD